jgi:HK97 family phage portal protein
MSWWNRRKTSEVTSPRAVTRSVADPALVTLFGGSYGDNVVVGEYSTLGSSAFYRAVMLISGTLASLPLRSYTSSEDGQPKIVNSIFDNPDGPDGQTPYEWKQTAFIHLLLHGGAFAYKVKTEAGALVRLPLIHPLSCRIEEPTLEEWRNPSTLPPGNKWFVLTLNDGSQKKLTSNEIFHVPAPSTDGIRGLGLISLARQSISTTLSADKAANKMFTKGAMISGLATPDPAASDAQPDITDDLPQLRREINREMLGVENAGGIAIVNRFLKLQPWTMTNADAQFLQQRQFSIEEVSRWTGVPPHLLMQTEKQTSWGTGVDEQNRGLGKFVLAPWATGFEQRGSRLLANPRWIEFDFISLTRPSPDKEIELLLKQTGKPFLTVNEARKIRNLPPVPGGDVLDSVSASPTVEEGEDIDPDAEKPE